MDFPTKNIYFSQTDGLWSADDTIDNLSMLHWINYRRSATVSIKNTVILGPLIICVKIWET